MGVIYGLLNVLHFLKHVLILTFLWIKPHKFVYVRYTTRPQGKAVYAILTFWPENNQIILGSPVTTTKTRITMLGLQTTLKWSLYMNKFLVIELPTLPINKMPSQWAWALKMENLKNLWKSQFFFYILWCELDLFKMFWKLWYHISRFF